MADQLLTTALTWGIAARDARAERFWTLFQQHN